ncbi:MAG: ATP-binding cassette domain-containing protein, partial [bacterium]|nr:ATP-binding cassette domain-containing protein [bacterium]
MIEVKDLSAYVDSKKILDAINLYVNKGEVVGIMGPNGSGKSTLVNVIMGNPAYTVEGSIIFEGEDITSLPSHIRARKGIFLSFQAPVAIDGLTLLNFLRAAYRNIHGETMKLKDFREMVVKNSNKIGFDQGFLGRGLNEGLSGG